MSDLTFQPGNITDVLDTAQLDEYLENLPEWEVTGVSTAMLTREYSLGNFVNAMDFARKITDLAEQFNHHPELTITYGKLRVSWWTHTASGIASNDIFMASRCDLIYQNF
ncbi:MAG: 4a-hydroxytetrahydrobiopterin dehydratase [Proteobacteria bacterium]|nr:4a-hydroxytetrahydrobiopterin dehydratase [Pseudomonadota bacterium]MDA1300460.1 4a-hydroxytetrahydrobiopterin dehydratase [Pseudomonadota bacterium]